MQNVTATKITRKDLEKVQIDHGMVFLDYGLTSQRFLAPTRGGGEFHASVEMRDIEFDGKVAKTKGAQVIDGNAATIKVTLLNMTQENLRLALPGVLAEKSEDGKITSPKTGVIADENYLQNVTVFGKTLDGKYKKFVINNPMSEGELGVTMQQKAEGELEVEFTAHDSIDELGSDLWEISDADVIEATPAKPPEENVPANPGTETPEDTGAGDTTE